MDGEQLSPGARLRLALDMFHSGLEVMRQNLRREHPGAADEEIRQLLTEWLQTRPGAEGGDSPGRPRDFTEPAA